MSIFEEFILTLMRLRLGLFQKDLAHRCNVSEITVSTVFNTWVRFMRVELEPLIRLPSKEVLHQYLPKTFLRSCTQGLCLSMMLLKFGLKARHH